MDKISGLLIKHLSYLGRYAPADDWLNKSLKKLPGKSSRYIGWCEVKAFSLWLRGDYSSAAAVAQEGVDLKVTTGVDTTHDCKHTLALILRDSGAVDEALPIFLGREELDQVLSPDFASDKKSGEYYGNIGRCLFLKSQYKTALQCYRISANKLMSREGADTINQGFAAFWIAEALEKEGSHIDALAAYRVAFIRWERVFPDRAEKAQLGFERMREVTPHIQTPSSDWEFERHYEDILRGPSGQS